MPFFPNIFCILIGQCMLGLCTASFPPKVFKNFLQSESFGKLKFFGKVMFIMLKIVFHKPNYW